MRTWTWNLYKIHVATATATGHLEYFILQDGRKYYFFLPFVVGPLIVFAIKLSLKNIIENMFFIFLKFWKSSSSISADIRANVAILNQSSIININNIDFLKEQWYYPWVCYVIFVSFNHKDFVIKEGFFFTWIEVTCWRVSQQLYTPSLN